ncbi:hypothetical protein H9L39_06879 [Fusarium oxysporum f. sp. albedinis]|nr:hypothetical protein H9L39_06879 [Fusarium oxysporum f. sp. albedinis]
MPRMLSVLNDVQHHLKLPLLLHRIFRSISGLKSLVPQPLSVHLTQRKGHMELHRLTDREPLSTRNDDHAPVLLHTLSQFPVCIMCLFPLHSTPTEVKDRWHPGHLVLDEIEPAKARLIPAT